MLIFPPLVSDFLHNSFIYIHTVFKFKVLKLFIRLNIFRAVSENPVLFQYQKEELFYTIPRVEHSDLGFQRFLLIFLRKFWGISFLLSDYLQTRFLIFLPHVNS